MNRAERQVREAVGALGDAALLRLHGELGARRPGAPRPAVGTRPRRRVWTYLEIWRLEAAGDEISRRGLRGADPPSARESRR